MPGSWSKLRDVAKLADSRAGFEFELAVGELPGLPHGVAAGPAPLQARMQFGRDQGMPIAHLAIEGTLVLVCQRCLQPMRHQLASTADVVIVDSEAMGERVSGDRETVLAQDGRVSCEALAMEELMLSLPLVPRHDDEQECAMATEAARDESETQRPFADLRSLLNRQRS